MERVALGEAFCVIDVSHTYLKLLDRQLERMQHLLEQGAEPALKIWAMDQITNLTKVLASLAQPVVMVSA